MAIERDEPMNDDGMKPVSLSGEIIPKNCPDSQKIDQRSFYCPIICHRVTLDKEGNCKLYGECLE
jgi:hypothetical protein